MIRRNLEIPLKKYQKQYPVIAIAGPRQSGKTTLAKEFFKNYTYVSLENLDIRLQAYKSFLHSAMLKKDWYCTQESRELACHLQFRLFPGGCYDRCYFPL